MRVWQTDRQTDDGQSDPYVSLCFAGDTKILSDWFMCTLINIVFANCDVYSGLYFSYARPRVLCANCAITRKHCSHSTTSRWSALSVHMYYTGMCVCVITRKLSSHSTTSRWCALSVHMYYTGMSELPYYPHTTALEVRCDVTGSMWDSWLKGCTFKSHCL